MGPDVWDYYLERMHRVYIVNHGTFVATALKAARLIFEKECLDRIILLND